MSLKYRTQGFVFKKNHLSEADQAFSVFTKDFGRIELRARAIRKITSKLRADIDILYFSEIEFIQGKNAKTLTDALSINKNLDFISDFAKLKAAHEISAIVDDFIKGQEKDSLTFDLVEGIFCKLRDPRLNGKNAWLAYQYFLWNFLSLQGYCLQTQSCARCRSGLDPNDIYFSAKEGGIICKNCSSSHSGIKKINSDAAKILRLIFKKDWQTIYRLKVEQASQRLLEDAAQSAIHAFCPMHC